MFPEKDMKYRIQEKKIFYCDLVFENGCLNASNIKVLCVLPRCVTLGLNLAAVTEPLYTPPHIATAIPYLHHTLYK